MTLEDAISVKGKLGPQLKVTPAARDQTGWTLWVTDWGPHDEAHPGFTCSCIRSLIQP
jgi:hypothetical protein